MDYVVVIYVKGGGTLFHQFETEKEAIEMEKEALSLPDVESTERIVLTRVASSKNMKH